MKKTTCLCLIVLSFILGALTMGIGVDVKANDYSIEEPVKPPDPWLVDKDENEFDIGISEPYNLLGYLYDGMYWYNNWESYSSTSSIHCDDSLLVFHISDVNITTSEFDGVYAILELEEFSAVFDLDETGESIDQYEGYLLSYENLTVSYYSVETGLLTDRLHVDGMSAQHNLLFWQ